MEGNALFAANKYAEGEAKYTEAIEVGGDNAILYANRAACKARLKRFVCCESFLYLHRIYSWIPVGTWPQRQTRKRLSRATHSLLCDFDVKNNDRPLNWSQLIQRLTLNLHRLRW